MNPHPAPAEARQFRLLVGAKLLSGLIGMAWLVLLTRMPAQQLGLYFAVVALAELVQHASSAGVNTYAERFLPADWVRLARGPLQQTLWRVAAWRFIPLGACAGVVGVSGPLWIGLFDWPQADQLAWICAALAMSEGLCRFAELALNAALRPGWSQALAALKNLARLAVVAALSQGPGQPPSAAQVLAVEVLVACVFTVVLTVALQRAVAATGLAGGGGAAPPPWRQRAEYSLQGWASLVLERLTGLDTLKLIVAHGAGPTSLAVFGLALALVDLVARYMPMVLFWGFFRTHLTAQQETGRPRAQLWRQAQAMTQLNAVFVLGAAPWMALFGVLILNPAATATETRAVQLGVAAMAGLPWLLSLRMQGSLLAHLDQAGHQHLRASASTVLVPLLVWALVPAWGAMASAMLGWWLLEALPTVVLWQGRLRQLGQLLGGARWWLGMGLASGAAATIALATQAAVGGVPGLWLAAGLYWLVFGAGLFQLHAAGALQPLRLNRLGEAIFGWPAR